MIYCEKCGMALPSENGFCTHCGAAIRPGSLREQAAQSASIPPESQVANKGARVGAEGENKSRKNLFCGISAAVIVILMIAAIGSYFHFFSADAQYKKQQATLEEGYEGTDRSKTKSQQEEMKKDDTLEKTEQSEITAIEAGRQDITGSLSAKNYYNLNIYISNLTESGLEDYNQENKDTEALLFFAYEHNFFNNQSAIEYLDEANQLYNPKRDYAYNIRISKKAIDKTLNRFFRVNTDALGGLHQVENYVNGYYYGLETGGNLPMGFALITKVTANGDLYTVECNVYGTESYDPSRTELYAYNHDQAKQEYGKARYRCSAVIKASSLENSSTYQVIRFHNESI